RRPRLLADLELVIAVRIVPAVGLAVVRVAIDLGHPAAPGGQDVVVASGRGFHRGPAVAADVVDELTARAGGIQLDGVSNRVVAAGLRGEAADAGGGER